MSLCTFYFVHLVIDFRCGEFSGKSNTFPFDLFTASIWLLGTNDSLRTKCTGTIWIYYPCLISLLFVLFFLSEVYQWREVRRPPSWDLGLCDRSMQRRSGSGSFVSFKSSICFSPLSSWDSLISPPSWMFLLPCSSMKRSPNDGASEFSISRAAALTPMDNKYSAHRRHAFQNHWAILQL